MESTTAPEIEASISLTEEEWKALSETLYTFCRYEKAPAMRSLAAHFIHQLPEEFK